MSHPRLAKLARVAAAAGAVAVGSGGGVALAQAPGGPPAVGTITVQQRAVTTSNSYTGRIQAIDRVALVPRVTAYLEQRLFKEGSEVKKGDLLYVLEQPPFQASVLSAQGTLTQAEANIRNANVQFKRQANLLNTPAGARENYDNALATRGSGAGQVLTAQGNLQTAQIQLGYTEIRAPVDGRITETSVNQGNVVSPSSGTLATIVTQDPMYVEFPVATRDLLEMQAKFAGSGGLAKAMIKVELPDGTSYDKTGTLDYVSPTVAANTDTITLRATIANPVRDAGNSGTGDRALFDGEFITAVVQSPSQQQALVIPQAAVLTDQQGNFVYKIDGQQVARRADVDLGQQVGTDVTITKGLNQGDTIVLDGLQRVHVGAKVKPAPSQTPPGQQAAQAAGASHAAAAEGAAQAGPSMNNPSGASSEAGQKAQTSGGPAPTGANPSGGH